MAVSIGTSSIAYPTQYSVQRKIHRTTVGKLIAIAQLGSISPGQVAYATSDDDGINWSAWILIAVGQSTATIADIDSYIDTNNDIYVVYSNTAVNLYFRKLTYSAGSWSVGSAIYVAGS